MILITGGTGFLGSTLIKQLIDQGIDVIATKRAQSIIPTSLLSSSLIQWVDADINDYFELEDALEGVTKVYHCAALVSYQKKDAKSHFKVNVEGTANIVNLCLEKNIRLLHVSSIAALGTNKDNLPVSEKDHWEHSPTTSNYSLSKYQAEMEVWRGITEGLNAVIVNPSVILGRQPKTKDLELYSP
ncbi:NAD-dependent epimerase/dehydratase family protein [Sphingobacterium sp. E70]|uniref:NAD-dependent epimerase/dehydratase family protein n=1 Tax=Sphingobacterium sp. E70 TaxID=2853439 RepID=UPI00211B8FDE|nr:NAD-dependent epimerase/dehydratase family protein [Sphingobacterium sp. E70]ULT28722.1 NAD-dependent epimerase/dehydratase family protein [Sphingobacterium sp. E70]